MMRKITENNTVRALRPYQYRRPKHSQLTTNDRGLTAPFDPSVVKRIINFAEEVNKMPGYVADLVTVSKDGYTLHVTKHEKSGKRMIEHVLPLHFDSEGRLRMDDVANRYTLMSMDLPITLFTGDET